MTRPSHLRLVRDDNPWQRPEAYADLRETRHVVIRRSYWQQLKDDWRDMVSEVRASPYSHAFVALATVLLWTVLLVAPLVIGERF